MPNWDASEIVCSLLPLMELVVVPTWYQLYRHKNICERSIRKKETLKVGTELIYSWTELCTLYNDIWIVKGSRESFTWD